MNHLFLGTKHTPEQVLETIKQPFFFLGNAAIADALLRKYAFARELDPSKHSFDYRKGIQKTHHARAFARGVYPDKDLMTYNDGKQALTQMLLSGAPLDQLPKVDHKGYDSAKQMMDDLLLSPDVRKVLCGPANFSFEGSVVARIDRAELGDDDAFTLGTLALLQAQGQIKGQMIVFDFGFYGRRSHLLLKHQNRLTAGLDYLAEIDDPKLSKGLLGIKDKHGAGCVFEDALELAKYEGKVPGTDGHTGLVQRLMAQ